ncbi:MAG: DNA topoisomerase I [Candidatus Micrarchaeota archaeon]|nr:DNA topoisomerase I [Candidatus Micrarchaeota archaeon]MCX8154538.1 DNA topoisomerase I [Candidatus Micrarchaeota archaeon]
MKIIIAEKPNVARKIKSIFPDLRYTKYKNIGYFRSDSIAVISGVGHVYQLDQVGKGDYPVFDLEWKPSYVVSDELKYTKPYIELAQNLRDIADEVIVATDFDIEGSLIGYNIARYALGRHRDLKRMKFSSLTYSELQRSWNDLIDFDYNNALAGEARHIVDWYYGINLSRYLMRSLQQVNQSKILSIGRVQAPTLALLIARDEEIGRFVPKDIFSVVAEVEGVEFENDRRFESQEELEKYISTLSNRGSVSLEIFEEKRYIYPPDLMTLQERAYYIYKITPAKTLSIAQSLYEKGMISYPRTSSQKYPKDLNVRKILENLKIHRPYIDRLLTKELLIPTSGKKTDPAHPAIYPTGISSDSLSPDESKIYDIIVRTFLATLSDPLILEIKNYTLQANDVFYAKGINIKQHGYLEIFPYNNIKIVNININPGEYQINYKTKKTRTKPPARYNEVSIISKLEDLKLGTKATRAMIVKTLFDRHYITKIKGSIYVTDLGKIIREVLYRYVPDLFSETFTRSLEEDLEKIQENAEDYRNVIKKAKEHLINIFEELRGKEVEVGKSLAQHLKNLK